MFSIGNAQKNCIFKNRSNSHIINSVDKTKLSCVYVCLQVIVFSIGDAQKNCIFKNRSNSHIAVSLFKISHVRVFKIHLWQIDDRKSAQHAEYSGTFRTQ